MNRKKVSPDCTCMHILHVDDDSALLDISKRILPLKGDFKIDTTTTVEIALKMMRSTVYDAVISDYELPTKNGLTFLTELRRQKNNIPFILFTGKGREEIAIKALNMGADGYVNKLGDLENVYSELSHLLKLTVARNKTEQKLKESEVTYQTAFESSLDAIVLVGEAGFFDCNRATLRLFRCKSVEDFVKKHPKDWAPPYQPDGTSSKVASDCHVKKAFEKGTDHFFFVHQRSDGKTFQADVLLTLIKIKGKSVLQATIRDITEQKAVEQQEKDNLERIAIMNEKLRVVSGLTRHDVRNKLSAILANSYLLKLDYGDQAGMIEALNNIESSVREADRIFEAAQVYEKLGIEKLVYIKVENAIEDAFALFSHLNIKLVNDCGELEVLADSFLVQLFYNFIDNTLNHGEKANKIRVHYKKLKDSIRLIYEDNGVGITSENKLCLFRQGFSTGGTSGFGLFLIKNMIDVYGWYIKEIGVPGEGAKFVITVPKLNKAQQTNYHL